jgi:hypothetical protein
MASVLRALLCVLRPKERQHGLDKLRCGAEEDRSMTAIGHNPKRGARNGAVHVDSHLHRIERTVVSSQLSVVSKCNRRSFDSVAAATSLRMTAQKETAPRCAREAVIYVGDDLLSHTLSRAVQSAQRGLTSVFGMGTGVSPAVRSPASQARARSFPAARSQASFHAGPIAPNL